MARTIPHQEIGIAPEIIEHQLAQRVPGALRAAYNGTENLLLRCELMSQVRDVARGYTQQEAGRMLGSTQPRLNQLLKGKISLFSLDALVNMLAKAGMRVSMKVKKAA